MNARRIPRLPEPPGPARFANLLCLGVLALCLATIPAGCATNKIDWNARVGSYSFDQAVTELGPPDKSATLTDGTRVAEWLAQRGSRASVHFGFGGGYYSPWHSAGWYMSDPASPDRMLRLTFGPDGKLREWKRVYR